MAGSVIGALRVNLGLDSAQFIKGTQNAQSAMKGMSAKMAIAGAAITAAIGGAAFEFAKLARESINTADEISKSAVKIGIATEELSRLRYAADLSGVSFEQLEKGLLILNRNMAGIGGESKKISEAFAQMGIETRNADGTLKSSTEVLKAMADVFARMPDGAEKSALAMAVLGKSGADMIPLINGGSAALQELTDEASKFGVVIDAETGRKAEEFNDNLTRLQGVFASLATQVAAELLPVLVDLTNMLIENAGKVRESAKGFTDFVRGLQVVTGYIASISNALTSAFGPAIDWARKKLGAFYEYVTFLYNPLASLLGLITRIGKLNSGGASLGWDSLNSMAASGNWLGDAAPRFAALGNAAEGAGVKLSGAGGSARGASSAFREMNRDAEEGARKLQSLMDRLFPAVTQARKMKEELALIDGSKLGDEEKANARLRLRTEGMGKAKVGLIDPGPIGDTLDLTKQLIGDFAKDAQIKTVTIAQSFAEMTRSITSSLQSFANSIRSGDFLGILGGVLDIFTQLGGAGVFGKGLQTRLNTPIGGARAMGGPVSMGKQYLVGENGPEMFAPGRSGQIIPNHAMGGSKVQIVPSPYFDVIVDGRIMSAAPAIAGAGAAMAQGQSAQRAQRRVR